MSVVITSVPFISNRTGLVNRENLAKTAGVFWVCHGIRSDLKILRLYYDIHNASVVFGDTHLWN